MHLAGINAASQEIPHHVIKDTTYLYSEPDESNPQPSTQFL
jgi:hypothetical protein